MFLVVLGFLGVFYLLGLIFSPFPCWPTYFRLWKHLLFDKTGFASKPKQFVFLLVAGGRAPIWTLLWYLDELLYPHYRHQQINPVFIIGQPRCGTTLLHRSLAHDSQKFFAVRHIEWRYPFISVHKLINWLGWDKKLEQVNYWPKSKAGEIASKMHRNRLSDWEEDGIFFEENFLHHFFIYLRFPYAELLPYLDTYPTLRSKDRRNMLEMHHKVLQKVSYLQGAQGRYYLSKEVTSHNKLPALLEQYPTARFIVVTRSSSQFMSSLMPLVRMSTWSKTGIDPLTLAHWESSIFNRMRKDSCYLVELCEQVIPLHKQTRVAAGDVMINIVEAVAIIYHELGLTLGINFINYLTELNIKQEDRNRGYEYSSFLPVGFEKYDAFVNVIAEEFRAKINTAGRPDIGVLAEAS